MSFRAGCSVCTHERRADIDTAVIAGIPVRDIAKTYALTKSAVHRHRAHVSTSIVRAAARAEIKYENTLLDDAHDLRARTLRLLDVAEETKDTRLQAVLFGQVRENIAMLSKLTVEAPPDEAAVKRVSRWWAEELEIREEELAEQTVKVNRINGDLLAGRSVQHEPKEPMPGGREYYLREAQKGAERLAMPSPQPPAVVPVAPPQSEAASGGTQLEPPEDEAPAPDPSLPPPLPGPWTLTI
jgi:hypothetical protein